MLRKLLVLFISLFLLPALLFAQDGKLRGKVTDKESGEPLIGANVVVEGTSLGASTDVNGEYIILSAPTGLYSIKVSYIGYSAITISNVRVSSNITTTQDFQLSSTAIQAQEIVIVAERPLVQRNTTNTIRLQTQDDIRNIPFRGLQSIVALNAGVVQQDGNLYVRGGRSGEVAFFLEGANTTNPINNTQSIGVIQEAIEEVQLQAGGYTAEFGGSNSAIIRTSLRSGTPDYHLSVSYQTDDFAKPGSSYLGGTSFGFRNGVVTLSGPILDKNFRFFVAGQHNYIRDRNQRWLVPFNFDSLRVDLPDSRFDRNLPDDQQVKLPGSVGFKENYLPGAWEQTNSVQTTLSYDFSPFKVRFTGSYSGQEDPNGRTWPGALGGIFRLRNSQTDVDRGFGELRLTHVLDPNTFYELGVSYQDIRSRTYDPHMESASGGAPLPITVGGSPFTPAFRDNWHWYTDSVVSEQLGFTGFRRRFSGPLGWSTINGFGFTDPNAPVGNYNRTSQSAWGLTADLTAQLSSSYELKVGGSMTAWTARNYNVGNISGAMEYLYTTSGVNPRSFADMTELSRELSRTANGSINYYGYDVFGNEEDSGPDGPKEPLFASVYVQNKFEYRDFILNLGARFEYYDTKEKTYADPNKPEDAFDDSKDIIDPSKLVESDPFSLVLPRISFSFPVTERTVFYVMYGKYAQLASLNQLYVGNTILSRTISPVSRGNAFLTPVGFLMKPERTTQYEMGFRQQLTDNFAFSVTGFYKDLKDQLSIRSQRNEDGVPLYNAYLNQDFGTTKGLELTLDLRRTNRLAARISYTMSEARGTASNSRSAQGAQESNIGIPSSFINPLDFNQAHRGTVMLDYRFSRDDGGAILEGLGVNALLSFNSGHPYTKLAELRDLGQATAWNVGVYPLIDPRFSHPVEPINSSTTPWFFNVDLNVSKTFWLGDVTAELYVNILNTLNTKQVLYVYPGTGTAYDDGWLTTPLASGYKDISNYQAFYKAINLDNQWAWDNAGRGPTGSMFGTPRQIRFGVRLEM
ncbi:MAG: TonB-dependent receptor [Ignavibacteriales bacterium]|nr:TonB-dependent receptor [Ignavibacteriales bacterium]